jgi:hypothetical protein
MIGMSRNAVEFWVKRSLIELPLSQINSFLGLFEITNWFVHGSNKLNLFQISQITGYLEIKKTY